MRDGRDCARRRSSCKSRSRPDGRRPPSNRRPSLPPTAYPRRRLRVPRPDPRRANRTDLELSSKVFSYQQKDPEGWICHCGCPTPTVSSACRPPAVLLLAAFPFRPLAQGFAGTPIVAGPSRTAHSKLFAGARGRAVPFLSSIPLRPVDPNAFRGALHRQRRLNQKLDQKERDKTFLPGTFQRDGLLCRTLGPARLFARVPLHRLRSSCLYCRPLWPSRCPVLVPARDPRSLHHGRRGLRPLRLTAHHFPWTGHRRHVPGA